MTTESSDAVPLIYRGQDLADLREGDLLYYPLPPNPPEDATADEVKAWLCQQVVSTSFRFDGEEVTMEIGNLYRCVREGEGLRIVPEPLTFGKPAEEPGNFLGDAKGAGAGGEACEVCQ